MDYKILNTIKSPEDIKKLNRLQLTQLCNEIRSCLINTVSKNGGHLASNLGAVELTVALHRVFNSPEDSIIFDVGHQSYTHKLLTGRFEKFGTLRKEGGISGFMRPDESEHDPFITGHSSNSISAAYGIYKAKCLSGKSGTAIAVIGDGAMTGGMAFEALNNAGVGNSKFVVILNDNKMSISKNVGSMAKYLNRIRSKASYHFFKNFLDTTLKKVPVIGLPLRNKLFSSKTMLKNAIYHSNIFEGLGFNYFGPVDGHNIEAIENILKISQSQNRPALIHVVTVKGKGYEYAENEPKTYHGIGAFDINNGAKISDIETYSDICGKKLCEMAKKDSSVCAITAAMTSGTGLDNFSKIYKNRFFDVGIAEEHAVTFSAGLASGGMKPYFVVYSSFLQRGYDQIIHDASIAGFPLRLLIDRAGVVGEDGETHQGIFDVSFLSSVPNITIYSPASFDELSYTLDLSLNAKGVIAIRYPKGTENADFKFAATGNDADWFFENNKKLIVTYGRISANACKAAEISGDATVLKLNKIFPIENSVLQKMLSFNEIHFFEESVKSGSISEKLSSMLLQSGYRGKTSINAIEGFVPCCKISSALCKYGLDTDSMINTLKGENNV